MSEMIVSKSGYLTFFHDYMRQAVERRYISPGNRYREKLITYFSSSRDKQRELEEVQVFPCIFILLLKLLVRSPISLSAVRVGRISLPM